MKKLLSFFVFLIFLIHANITQAKTYRIGMEATFPPFEYKENGKTVGFDIDLIKEIEKNTNYQIQLVEMGLDALIPAVKTNNIDMIISGISITSERSKSVLFSDPYFKTGLQLLVLKENDTIKNIDDLNGKKLGVELGSTAEVYARKLKGVKVKTFSNMSEMNLDLINKGIDASLNDTFIHEYYLAHGGAKYAKIVGDTVEKADVGIAFNKKNIELKKEVDIILNKLKKDGTYEKIYTKWFGKNNTKPAERGSIFNFIKSISPLLLSGTLLTIQISGISFLIGLLIGCSMGIIRLCPSRILRIFATFYIDFLRGTPLLVQIFMIYFALPQLLDRHVDAYFAAITACSLNIGAYIAEVIRSGIQSIDKGQMEASFSLGLSWFKTMRFVILPQTFKRIIPQLGNELIALLKDSSLVSVIGFEELTRQAQIIISQTYASLEVWMAVSIIYLMMTIIISQSVKYIEKRWAKSCQ